MQSLLAQLVTPEDAAILHKELQLVAKTQYQVGVMGSNSSAAATPDTPLETVLRTQVRAETAKAVRLLRTDAADQFYKAVAEADAQLVHLPTVEASLAYQPTLQQLQQLHDWFVSNLQQAVLLKPRYQPSLLAGIQFSWAGHFWDMSLRKDLENTSLRRWNVATK